MVFLSNLLRTTKAKSEPGLHRYWKRRRILSMAGHFYGRKRRCYGMAIRAVHRSFLYDQNGQRIRILNKRRTYTERLGAACREFDTDYETMRRTLSSLDIGLDRESLQNLAIWEPRTFRGLAMLTKALTEVQGLNSLAPPPPGVITRGMLNVEDVLAWQQKKRRK